MKALAILALICSLGLCGFVYAYALRKRVRELKEFLFGLELLETEIVYAKNPLWYAFLNLGKSTDGIVSEFFTTVGQGMREHRFHTAEDGFLSTLEGFQNRFSLQEKDLAILKQFASNLGVTDGARQGEKIKTTQCALEMALTSAKGLEEKWGRVAGLGGWIMGIVIGLLLI